MKLGEMLANMYRTKYGISQGQWDLTMVKLHQDF